LLEGLVKFRTKINEMTILDSVVQKNTNCPFTTILCFVFLSISLSACLSGHSNKLHGAYKLLKIEENSDSGWVQANWMRAGQGYLQYSSNGIMSVHFTPADYKTTGEGAYWYVADYAYFPDEGLVRHKRLLHSDTSEIGEKVTRRIHITGDRLFMFAEEYNFRLTWEKISEH
jgi:hypothetical protein